MTDFDFKIEYEQADKAKSFPYSKKDGDGKPRETEKGVVYSPVVWELSPGHYAPGASSPEQEIIYTAHSSDSFDDAAQASFFFLGMLIHQLDNHG